MKKITTLLFFLSFVCAQAQVYISPKNPSLTDEITLTFHADEGNGELAGFDGDIYAHTGLITAQSTHAGDWKFVAADWGENKAQLKLTRTGTDRYELKFTLAELYGVGPMQSVVGVACVFRNADGSKVGRADGSSDIFHFFKKPSFREPPKVLAESEAYHPEWARSATIYEVNVRQYTPEGTFEAFAEHLPRLRQMGIDILWFMPIYPIGVEDRKGTLGSYYSISDYTAVNPEFGTLEDFKRLVDHCHGMGFHVVLDWVANHTSRDHPWIEAHPNWYIWGEDGEPAIPSGWDDTAELEYENYYLRQAMTDAMEFWVEECDVDGFRCDVAGDVPADFWEDTRRELDEIKPVWMLAENADQLHLLNRAFNANYAWTVHHLMNEIAKGNEPANRMQEVFEQLPEAYPIGSYPMNFITNHDENSWNGTVFERLGDGHRAFAVLTFTMPGMPLIYAGQEAGMKKRLEFFEKDPIDWGNFKLVGFYSQLDELKSVNRALWNGPAGSTATTLVNNRPETVLAFSRKVESNEVITLLNFSPTERKFTVEFGERGGTYHEFFSGEKMELGGSMEMSLPAWGYRVFVRN